jgi:glucose/arabinose dehydrogenase
MHFTRLLRAVLLAAAALLTLAVTTDAATAPPLPVAKGGQTVEVVGKGVPTPTAFAFDGETVFAGSGPDEGTGAGGLFVLSGGEAKLIANSPKFVFGLVWHGSALYVSTGPTIVAYEGWNGTAFSSNKTIYKNSKKGFPGFNGLAFGPDGRLYAGLALDEKHDHSKDPFPISQGVVSMTASGKGLKVIARGLRQPFQLTFPSGSSSPYVSVLGQDEGKAPRDQIVVAKTGSNFGFPSCVWLTEKAKACKRFDKPKIFLPPHTSPMGIGSIGKTLYVALFGGTDKHPEVVTIPTSGGKATPFLTGFPAPVIGLSINKGSLYVGDLTGTIYKIVP